MSLSSLRQLAAFSVLSSILVYSGGAMAACKGMDESSCTADAACTWVAGYARKDGVAVQGYCRTKPMKSGKTEAAAGDNKSAALGTAIGR